MADSSKQKGFPSNKCLEDGLKPALTVDDVVGMKRRLEESILTLLEAYSRETGLMVRDISLQLLEERTIGMREATVRPVRVILEVQL